MNRFFFNFICFLLAIVFSLSSHASETSLQLLGSREGDPDLYWVAKHNQSYAKKAVKGFGDPPYTLVRTQVPNSILDGAPTLVDGGIPAWVISDHQLEGLIPEVLTWMAIPK